VILTPTENVTCVEYNFQDDGDHMLTLSDDQQGANSPTKENIINALKWLIKDAKAGDSLFFHYSGHGGTEPDPSGA
jgi:uncharacterized caspase-like protein